MAPHGEAIVTTNTFSKPFSKPPRLSNDHLQRTTSDISFELTKELASINHLDEDKQLPPISEIDDTKCECCGMSEECSQEYVEKIRSKFCGSWICGLCAEAVKEEKEKCADKTMEEALSTHMNACSKFNKFGRAYPVLFQAEAMREMLKKSTKRAKSFTPGTNNQKIKGGIARSSSCIPAITRDMTDLSIAR